MSETKIFKVGDKVRCIKEHEFLTVGREYKIEIIQTNPDMSKQMLLWDVDYWLDYDDRGFLELIEETNTQSKIRALFDNGKEFILAKNIKYGDSALSPIQIFSKESPDNQICNRIDDKLSRIKNSKEFRKNDLVDLWGYISLLLIQNNWINFDDLID